MSHLASHKLIQTPEGILKAPEFIQFCQWSALPKDVREPKEQKQFAEVLGVDEATLPLWKRTAEFEFNRRLFIRQWLGDDLPDVMQVVKKNALRGDVRHVDTLLKWLGEFQQDTGVQVNIQNNTLNVNLEDIEAGAKAWILASEENKAKAREWLDGN